MDGCQNSDLEEKEFDDSYAKNFTYGRDGEIVYLKFKPNTLYSYPSKKFIHFSDLTYLCLRSNHLKCLDAEIFSYYPNLNWLDVRDNRLQSFPKFINHKSMEQILLGGNKIEKLPIELGSFENLIALQVTGNPLTFPDLKAVESSCYNLVEYLKLCWKNQTKNPLVKNKGENKPSARKKHPLVKKEECTGPVKQFRAVASIVAEKMKSSDPVDQILATNVLKKLRTLEVNLKKYKDQTALKEWREKYRRGPVRTKQLGMIPYGVDPVYMTMLTRKDLLRDSGDSSNSKRPVIRNDSKPININEELKKVDMELNNLKNRKPSLDPNVEKSLRLKDIEKMNEIQKKIKELQLVNFSS